MVSYVHSFNLDILFLVQKQRKLNKKLLRRSLFFLFNNVCQYKNSIQIDNYTKEMYVHHTPKTHTPEHV